MSPRRLAALLLVSALVLALVPALRAEPPEAAPATETTEEIDILDVSPDELKGADTERLVAEAHRAYQDTRYADSARAYIRALRQNPGDSNALYNLACCYGLLGHAKQAAAFLDASWQAGFRDLDHIRNDRDFEKVRNNATFVALIERLDERDAEVRAARGKLLTVVAPTVQTVRVIAPDEMSPWKRYPVVIGLHGYGSNSESFAGLFVRRGIEQPFIYVAAQAPYASHSGSRIGFSWGFATPGGDTATGITSHLLSEQYVLAVLETVKRHYRVDERRVFLMGFSQGAGQAFSIGLAHPELFRGVIPIGGWCDAGEHSAARVAHAAKHGLFLVCHSPEDRMVEWEACKTAVAFLKASGIRHAVLRYPGGHSIPAELAQAIVDWIQDPGTTPPTLGAQKESGEAPAKK